jgi:hypothetical protein
MQQDLFPPIGSVAQKADNAPVPTGGDGDEKMLEEIESLCMKCGENVSQSHTLIRHQPDT